MKLFITIMQILLALPVMAQAPMSFSYQTVVRDETGEPMAHADITIEVALLKGSIDSDPLIVETHNVTTNEHGLVNLQVGSVVSLEDIEWGDDIFFIELSAGGITMGTSQLLSVPYALHSHTSADAFSGKYEDLEGTPDLDKYIAFESPLPGDMFYYYESIGWSLLPAGDENDVLQVVSGGIPGWVSDPAASYVGDADGNIYKTITIGGQRWMAENLRTTRYRDGSPILTGLSASEWETTTDGAFEIYPHQLEEAEGLDCDSAMVAAYARIYNWHAVHDDRGLCPEGWRVPTDADFTQLEDFISLDGHDGHEANALKAARQVGHPWGGEHDTEEHPRWSEHDPPWGGQYGTDEYQFAAFPSGGRNFYGLFFGLGNAGYFWTQTKNDSITAWRRSISHSASYIGRSVQSQQLGFSVRCIKDE